MPAEKQSKMVRVRFDETLMARSERCANLMKIPKVQFLREACNLLRYLIWKHKELPNCVSFGTGESGNIVRFSMSGIWAEVNRGHYGGDKNEGRSYAVRPELELLVELLERHKKKLRQSEVLRRASLFLCDIVECDLAMACAILDECSTSDMSSLKFDELVAAVVRREQALGEDEAVAAGCLDEHFLS